MKKRFWNKFSAVILVAVVSVGLFPAAGNIHDWTVGPCEAKAAESEKTDDVITEEELSTVSDEYIVTEVLEGEEVTSLIPLDNDALFEGYAEIQLDISSVPEKTSTRGSKLSGTNLAVYQKLKNEISRVADGEKSSTVFEVTLKDLGLENKVWTAEELGVSAIVNNGKITKETTDALTQMLDFDLDKVFNALLADCPYELYWYDKVSGVATTGPGISASSNGTEWTARFGSGIVFSLSVAQGYAAGEYAVDTTNGERVRSAVNTAESIVSDSSSKSDYDKLVDYKIKICELVSYDSDAADDNNNTPYGDPWQIISVFDGDTSTNVVCEGYAKSFQYLCDQTTFEDDIICATVTGTMSGGTGAGAHMWNVINMDDGKNYLVDVTNCDEGTVGADDLLFVAACASGSLETTYSFEGRYGNIISYNYDESTRSLYTDEELEISANAWEPPVTHRWNEGVVTKAATCTEKGIRTYTCTDCGETKTEEIPALGHEWSEVTYTWSDDNSSVTATRTCNHDSSHVEKETVSTSSEVTKAATCELKGETTYTATFSNDVFESQSMTVENITALGHDWGGVTYTWSTDNSSVTAMRTCNHDSSHVEKETVSTSSEVTKAAKCDSKGETTYTAMFTNGAFETQSKVEADLPALGHNWDEEAVTTVATCTEKGVKTYSCTVCRKTRTEEIPATGHHFGNWVVIKEATENSTGLRESMCTSCGEKKTEAIPKLAPSIQFTDMPNDPKNPDFDKAIFWAVDNGITTGWADGTFRPWRSINRAAVVTFLWRANGCPAPKSIAKFSDMPANTPANQDFRKAISWAAEKGITTGYSDGTFKPWADCNRAAIVTFIWRSEGKPSPGKTAGFKDMTNNSDFNKAISWGVSKGIIAGWSDNTFRPWRNCNRAATVTFLYRLKGK